MREKLRLLSIAISMAIALIAPAKAAVFNITPLDLYPTTVPGPQSSFFNNAFATPGTFFDDLWTFDVSGAGATIAANASALSTAFNGALTDQSPLGLQLRLLAWNGVGYNTVLVDTGVTLAPFVGAPLDAHQGGAPGHGFYALEILGNTPPGSLISQYSGQIQAVAVPEPSTYLMLFLGGSLLVGWQARRARQRAHAAGRGT